MLKFSNRLYTFPACEKLYEGEVRTALKIELYIVDIQGMKSILLSQFLNI